MTSPFAGSWRPSRSQPIDRLHRFSNDLWERALEELDYIRILPIQVWDRLARTADHAWQGSNMKHEVLQGALVTAGYLYMDVFYRLKVYPLLLTEGDTDGKLDELARAPPNPNWD